MIKKIFAGLLAVLLLMSTAAAYTEKQQNTADALNSLELFLGTGNGYDLDGKLTRAQGITLLVRMLGYEKAAQSGSFTTPFTDIPDWAKGYIGYAYENSLTNGISTNKFGPDNEMTDYMFLTLVLRALGHTDSGEKAEFVWDNPYELAKTVGLTDNTEKDTSFTRGEAIEIFWRALLAYDGKLSDDLIKRGVFTKEQFSKACDIQKNGKSENPGVPVIPDTESGDSDSTEPIAPVTPSNPEAPGQNGNTTESEKTISEYTYEDYISMTGDEQAAFIARFDSIADFFVWLNAEKKEYEENQDIIEIGGNGTIDLGDAENKNNG